MTAPTREQILQWARSIEGVRVFDMGGSIFGKPEYLERFAALAFAAGQSAASDHTDLLRRCRPIVQADAQMMADISRHAPLDPTSQAEHDTTEYESEKLLPLIDAALSSNDARPCTCHPDDNPPKPCPRKYALSECRAAASGSGAELVREVEEAAARITNMPVDSLNNDVRDWIAEEMCSEPFWWPRIRSAVIAGDTDAKRLEWMQFHGARVSWGNDDEMCSVVWSDRDGEQYKTALHSDWRAAIDEAMGTRT